MCNRSTILKLCHGVLILALSLGTALSARAGGSSPAQPKTQTYLENVLANSKGSIDVEWEMTKITSGLFPSPNSYHIKILAPAVRQNVSLLVDEKPVVHPSFDVKAFDFDFTNYGKGEHKVTLLVFDSVKAGSSSKTVEVVNIPGAPVPLKK